MPTDVDDLHPVICLRVFGGWALGQYHEAPFDPVRFKPIPGKGIPILGMVWLVQRKYAVRELQLLTSDCLRAHSGNPHGESETGDGPR